jgi:hypothetical protein
MCIRSRGNVSTEPLPSNNTGIFTEPLPSSDRVNTHTRAHRHRQQRDLISLLYFFKIGKWANKNITQITWIKESRKTFQKGNEARTSKRMA